MDSSVLLAVFNRERGWEKLTPEMLGGSAISCVNAAEVQGKLVAEGIDGEAAWNAISGSVREIVSFNSQQARLTGELISRTRSLGLSLGDRACIALGLTLNAPVYTMDRSWAHLKIEIPIHAIR